MTQVSAPTRASQLMQPPKQQEGPAPADGRPPRIASLEALVKDAEAAQNALSSAEACGVGEAILKSRRRATTVTVARAEQAKPLILWTG